MVGGGAHRVGVPLLRAGGAGGGGPVAAVAAGDGAAAQQRWPPAPAAAPGGEAGSEGLAAAAEHAAAVAMVPLWCVPQLRTTCMMWSRPGGNCQWCARGAAAGHGVPT